MIGTPDRPTVDVSRMADLGQYRAAVVIYPDGQEMLWLLAATDDGQPGCQCAKCAPHEQLGRPVFPNRKATS